MMPHVLDTNILLYSISRNPAESFKRDRSLALLDDDSGVLRHCEFAKPVGFRFGTAPSSPPLWPSAATGSTPKTWPMGKW